MIDSSASSLAAPISLLKALQSCSRVSFFHITASRGTSSPTAALNGTVRSSSPFVSAHELAGVQLRMSTAFHPQSTGLTERTNEVVTSALRHYAASDMADWDEMLPLVEFAMNSSYHEAIQTTPFKMNRITLPANPVEVLTRLRSESSTELASWVGMSEGERTYAQAHEEYQRARRCV